MEEVTFVGILISSLYCSNNKLFGNKGPHNFAIEKVINSYIYTYLGGILNTVPPNVNYLLGGLLGTGLG